MHTGKWMITCIAAIGLLSAGVTHAASTLEVWVPWGGDRIPRFEAIGRAFTQSEPGINVRFTTAANNLESNEKFFVAVASGAPPDVIFVDGPQVAPWAHAGALVPLDGYIRQAGLSERDFFVPAWRQLIYRGRIWALPAQTNPMLGFFWNKTIFAEVGLPDAAPATIPELDAYNRRIMRSTEDGRLERFGLIPWAVYGYANSLFNWGWIFGGRFFDEERQEFTVNDPR
ncbi:MAG TPA: extracellular solute-binding protein, partial [Limnochordia bacterium]